MDFRRLASVWGDLDEDAREAYLENIVNKQLKKSGLPHTPIEASSSVSGAGSGSFSWRNWKMTISKDAVRSPNAVNEVAKLVYHEARHAEQLFAAARTVGGQGMRLPASARNAAFQAPLAATSSPMGMLGQMSHQSIFHDVWGKRRTRILNKPNTDLLADMQYRALPEEQDAYQLDAMVDCL